MIILKEDNKARKAIGYNWYKIHLVQSRENCVCHQNDIGKDSFWGLRLQGYICVLFVICHLWGSCTYKIFHDLNPKAPTHWYYSEILHFHELAQAKDNTYGYNYGHFTIADNLSVSDEKLKKILSTHEKGTVWYDRDIKGVRIPAEGIVFKDFTEHTDNYIVSRENVPKAFKWVAIGFDIGGNGSAYALTCSAQGYDDVIYILKSTKRQAPDLPMNEVETFVFDFVDSVEKEYGVTIEDVACDHSDVIINTLNEKQYIFGKTCKPPLDERPRQFSLLMATGRFKLVADVCNDLVEELKNLVYDSKQDKPICSRRQA